MAVGPIPVTAIWEWCDRHGLDDGSREILTLVIRKIDNDKAEAEASKRELERATGAGQKGARR